MNRNQETLERGSYGTLLLNLCIPTIVIMLVTVVYNMADIYFIGQTGDENMIAAVSLCSPLFSILSGLGTLFGSGGCTSISLALGRGDKERVKNISALCFTGAAGIGILFLAAVLAFLAPVCGVLGADDATLGFTEQYLRVIAIGAPVILFTNVFMNLIRADGAAKVTMAANLLGTFTNIILDPIFILALNLGVTGAAIATVLGNVVSAGFILWYCLKKTTYYSFRLKDVRLQPEVVLPVVTLGLPMAFSTILMSVSHMFSNNLMMDYGATAMSAQSVAGKINMLISMTAMGICMGMQPAISYNFAQKNGKRTGEILKKTAVTCVVVGSVLTLFCLLFRDRLILAFIDSPEVLSLGRFMLTASLAMGPFYGLYQLCTTYLQSTGRAGYATFASLLNKGLIFLPVLIALHAAFGLYGIACTAPVTDALSLIAAFLLCRLAVRRDSANEGNPSADTLSTAGDRSFNPSTPKQI